MPAQATKMRTGLEAARAVCKLASLATSLGCCNMELLIVFVLMNAMSSPTTLAPRSFSMREVAALRPEATPVIIAVMPSI